MLRVGVDLAPWSLIFSAATRMAPAPAAHLSGGL